MPLITIKATTPKIINARASHASDLFSALRYASKSASTSSEFVGFVIFSAGIGWQRNVVVQRLRVQHHLWEGMLLELKLETIAHTEELLQLAALESGHALVTAFQRVDELPLVLHREVQVRAGRTPRIPHITNHLPLPHAVATLQPPRKTVQVCVGASVLMLVYQRDHVACCTFGAHKIHHPIRDSDHGCSRIRSIIHAQVRTNPPQNWVHTRQAKA